MKRRRIVLGGLLAALGVAAAMLLRPRPVETLPCAELVPADAVLYAAVADLRTIEELPGLEELAARLAPARAHLSGAAAVYLDRHGDWVVLARLTRLAALVAGGEVENGAAVVARTPAALERHKARRRSILELDAFRRLGTKIFVNLDALPLHARRDFSAIGLELAGTKPLVLRGRALYRGDLFRLYVEQYLQAPTRASEARLGGVFIEPLSRIWDDVLLGLNPIDKDRTERVAGGLARDFYEAKPFRDFLRRLGGAWAVELTPTSHGFPAATLALELPDADLRDRLARMLPKMTADVAKFHKDRGEAPPWELAAERGVWRIRIPRAAELRMGAAFDPAYAIRDGRLLLTTCAAALEAGPARPGSAHLALALETGPAFELARACAPLVADAAFREEAERAADTLYAKAFTPAALEALRRQLPEPADLRKFLETRRAELRARALEELAKSSPKYAEELAKVRGDIDGWAARLAGVGRLELSGRYASEGLELEVLVK